MLTMMLAAAFATALAPDPTSGTSDPPAALPVASAPPPGAAPGARIFSYADLKAMDAKVSDRASPSAHAAPAHVHAQADRRRGRREPLRHAAASPASPHPASPSLRPAFALEKTAKVTR